MIKMKDLKTKAKAIQDAHYYGIVPMLKELITQLGYDNYHVDGDHGLSVINVRDVIAICKEIETY